MVATQNPATLTHGQPIGARLCHGVVWVEAGGLSSLDATGPPDSSVGENTLPSKFDGARLRLARLTVAPETPFRSALHDVAVIAAKTLAVGRVSVWRFLDGGRSIRCHFLHQPGRPDVLDGVLLHRSEFPHYFRALISSASCR